MDMYQFIYIAAALAATIAYNYAGYLRFGKAKGEAYDYSKLLATLFQGGLVASVLTYVTSVTVSGSGFDVWILAEAILFGLGLSAGIDKLQDTVSPKQSGAELLTSIIADIEALKIKMEAQNAPAIVAVTSIEQITPKEPAPLPLVPTA
jgi:hypothetical protein